MHEDYDYDDDEYDDYDNHDNLNDKYKHYFKFDPQAWDVWGKWLYDALNDIVETSPNVWYIGGIPTNKFPVNSYFSSTGKNENFYQYLGSNYQGYEVWKTQYFINDPINYAYKLHLQSNAKHFLQQPNYYKGLFDILN
jgi:hypothetical protein